MNNIKLNIGERDLDFSLGLYFLGEVLEDLDYSNEELSKKIEKNPYKWIPFIMYKSAEFAFTRKGEQPDFTEFDFSDWIVKEPGAFGSEVVTKFFEAFKLSMTKNVPQAEPGSNKGAKKK